MLRHGWTWGHYALFGELVEDLSLGGSLSDSSEGLLRRGKGRARIYRSFVKNKPGIEHQKISSNWRKNKQLKLMNLALFYVWEDARVWAHWNHSFDTHLNYLGPVSYFSPSWIPSGYTVRGVGGCNGWWLDGHNILCLLIQQVTFFVHIRVSSLLEWWGWGRIDKMKIQSLSY